MSDWFIVSRTKERGVIGLVNDTLYYTVSRGAYMFSNGGKCTYIFI